MGQRPPLLQINPHIRRRPSEDGHARSIRRIHRSHGLDARVYLRGHVHRHGRIPASGRGDGDESQRPGRGVRVHGAVSRVMSKVGTDGKRGRVVP